MLTIFTPTYNRAYCLHQLYNSLCTQTCKDFEWVIVDDGSTDNTKDLVSEWCRNENIKIRYIYQENGGKSSAHNRGVKETETELFTCVDSDDYLTNDAVEVIIDTWSKEKKNDVVGILAFRKHSDDSPITKIKDDSIYYSTISEAYKKHGLNGDTILVFRTDVINQFEFPMIEGEKFIPEGYLYNKIDRVGKVFILRKALYVCEYLPDGYTSNVSKLIFNNYRGYALHINERIKMNMSIKDVIMDTIRYNSVMIAHKEKKFTSKTVYPFLAKIFIPAGFLLAKIRYGKYMGKD